MKAKIFALSSGKLPYQVLSPKQHKIIQNGKFTYSPIGKAFEKQAKTI